MSQTSSENANSIEAASASEDDAAFSSATEKDGELAALPTSVVMRTHMSDDTAFGDGLIRYDNLYKLLVVGDSGVGKSCLIERFVSDTFDSKFLETIVIDFKMKVVDLSGKKIKLQIWDTSGQDKYVQLCENFFRCANGAVFVYDVNNRASFHNLKKWMRKVKENAKAAADLQTVIVASKTDQDPSTREVTREEGHVFAIENGSRE